MPPIDDIKPITAIFDRKAVNMTLPSVITALRVNMIRRMVTQMVIARLIPVAIKFGKKAFRKKKPAVDPNADLGNAADAPKLDVVDETNG